METRTMKYWLAALPWLFLATPSHAGPVAAAIAAFASTTIGGMIVNALIGMVVNQIFGAGKKRSANQQERSILVNKNSSNAPIPVVYGKRRVGGTRVYIGTSDGDGNEDTEYLNMVLALCEGQMGLLTKVYFNDEVVFDGTLAHAGIIDDSNEVEDNKYAGTFEIQYMDGRDNQTTSTLMSDSISDDWTANHRLRGVAYLAIKLQANPDKYQGGVPLITCVMNGKQITSTANYSTSTSSQDQNPVDVIYDYLTNTRYGKGLDGSANGKIDRASFTQARTECGSYYKINGALQTDVPLYENITEILDSANLQLLYANGKYTLKLRKQNEPVAHSFDKDTIIGAIQVDMPQKRQKKNKMTVTFPDAGNGYEFNENIAVVENSTYRSQDGGEVLEGNLTLDLVTSETLATALAQYKMDFSRHTQIVNFEAPHTKIPLEVADIISITNSDFGFSNALFRVLSIEITTDNTQKIVAQKYVSNIELT